MVASVSKMGRDSWRYYHERAAGCPSDYYSGKGEHPGHWYGDVNALAALGLTRDEPVTEQEMADLYGWGLHPRTRNVLGRLGGPNSVAGFGVTFSSPKSFSAAWASAAPETSRVFDAAHRAGVRAGLDFLGRHAMWSRIGAGGAVQVATAGLVAAVYEHSTARPTPWSPGDPQKHTHCLIPNKVLCVDGAWRSLDGREIYAHAKAAQAIALAVERAYLARELGVVFEPTNEHGHGEIAGIPKELTKAWSKRRAQIEGWSDSFIDQINHERVTRGLPTMSAGAEAACRQEAALQTRRAKTEGETPAERHARWCQEANDLGIDADHFVRDPTGDKMSKEPPDQAQTAVAAVERASERKATFTRNDVVVAACSLLPAASVGPDEVSGWVEQYVDAALDNPDQVIALPSDRNAERRWVTGRQLMLEARVLTTVASGAIPDRPGIDPMAVEARLDVVDTAGRELTDGQREAVRQLCRGNRYGFLVAPAGAGKTTAMSPVVDLHLQAGFHVIGLAPSARAARVLADETGAPAKTLARYLRDGCRGLDDRTLVLVDEAGMVGSYDWGRLIDAVEGRGARLGAIGDPRQLTSPGQPGDLFDVLVRTLPHATSELHEVLRFVEPWEREASAGLRLATSADDADRVLSRYESHGRVTYSPTQQAGLDAALAAWHADRLAGKDALLLAPSRDQVRDLNARARIIERAEGRITKDEVPIGDNAWAVGDVAMTRRNAYRLRDTAGQPVLNGDRWRVIEVVPSGLRVQRAEGGATVHLPVWYVRAALDHGYATTIHGAQGASVDTAHALASQRTDREALYVAMTRARQSNHLYFVVDAPEQCGPGRPAPDLRDRLLNAITREEDGSGLEVFVSATDP